MKNKRLSETIREIEKKPHRSSGNEVLKLKTH